MGVNVTWLGSMPNSQIPQYLHKASLLIQPSKFEGHPKSLIEAMACGAAVIASDVPGIREIIRHGETGWLCPPDADALRSSIKHLIANRGLRVLLGQAARKEIVTNYALDNIAAQEYVVLESLS
jgi:glycosyltransferase involved in cell wall biosynthesis